MILRESGKNDYKKQLRLTNSGTAHIIELEQQNINLQVFCLRVFILKGAVSPRHEEKETDDIRFCETDP